MRLIYVIDSLGYGGAERSLVAMLPHYRAVGIETTIASLLPRQTSLVDAARDAGANVVFAPRTRLTSQVWWLRNVIREFRADVLHTTLFRADLVGRGAAAFARVPVLTSLVNTQYGPARAQESDISSWKLAAAQQLEAWTGRFLTDHFHANSDAVAQAAERDLRVPRSRVTIVPRGRDPQIFTPDLRRHRDVVRGSLGIAAEAPVVLSIGRQEPQKGQVYLLRAFAAVLDQVPEAKLLIVGGEGASTAHLKVLRAELGMGESVRFLGRRDDVPELLGASDIFALASLWEGLPNVVIEAMAAGIAVVASDIPPVREAVEVNGSAIVFEPANSQALCTALLQLINDKPLRQKLGTRGREVFLQYFTIEPVVERMCELYQALATGTAR